MNHSSDTTQALSQSLEAPFNQLLGLQLTEWSEGHARLEVEVKPEFANSHGIPHGGFLCTVLDVASSISGLYCPDPKRVRRALTLSLNTSFVGQAKTNQLYAIGRVTSSGYKIYYATAEVYDSENTLLATAQAVLKYNKGSETLEGVSLEDWQQRTRDR